MLSLSINKTSIYFAKYEYEMEQLKAEQFFYIFFFKKKFIKGLEKRQSN